MALGRPIKVKNLIRALTMLGALMFLKGMASGNLVDVHIMVSKYWLPALVLGSGPTQSTKTRLNGSSIAGIGISGATRLHWFGIPVT